MAINSDLCRQNQAVHMVSLNQNPGKWDGH